MKGKDLIRKEFWLSKDCIKILTEEGKQHRRKFKPHSEFVLEEYARNITKSIKAVAILLIVSIVSVKSQTVISSAGNQYTVGEVVTFSSSGGNVTQGFHQPTIKVTQLLDVREEIEASVYPNPVTEIVYVKIAEKDLVGIQYTLTDMNGKIMLKNKNPIVEESIDMGSYTIGYYLLVFTKNGSIIKTFKVIKE